MDRSDCVLLPEFAHRDVLDSPLTLDELRASVDRHERLDVVLAVSLHDVYQTVRTDQRLLLHLRGNAGLILDNKGGAAWS
ncbi:hypothetical protein [Sulfobacillus harzensis]|uniref:Uncharacterized protein n=1 Tax=Sulfobacillus harzensis TaxID=2729629 RepID=A0A7Y0L7W5_9FIRM|nr:hypothetical protein [Sulfobacillus harzensis]NMP24942.1 hypothetical protein [Sulfobacillus harzensis]